MSDGPDDRVCSTDLNAGLMAGTVGVGGTLGSAGGERVADVVGDAAAHGTVVDHRTVGVCAARRRVAGVRCWSRERK